MSESTSTTRIPTPLYAAAGAGELALEQLRRLPDVVTGIGVRAIGSAFELRAKAATTLKAANNTTTVLRERAATADLDLDLDRLRETALRNAAAVRAGALVAQERATAVYDALVARGERLVGAGVVQAADTVNSDIEATDAATTVSEATSAAGARVPTPADVAEVTEAKTATTKAASATKAASTTKAASATKAATPARRTGGAKKTASTGGSTRTATSGETPSAKQPRSGTKRTSPAAE